MPTYRMTIDRTVRFQLDLEADSRLDALQKIMTKALHYDDRDLKETNVVAIKELPQTNVHNSFD